MTTLTAPPDRCPNACTTPDGDPVTATPHTIRHDTDKVVAHYRCPTCRRPWFTTWATTRQPA